jgi:hypothetical protein
VTTRINGCLIPTGEPKPKPEFSREQLIREARECIDVIEAERITAMTLPIEAAKDRSHSLVMIGVAIVTLSRKLDILEESPDLTAEDIAAYRLIRERNDKPDASGFFDARLEDKP